MGNLYRSYRTNRREFQFALSSLLAFAARPWRTAMATNVSTPDTSAEPPNNAPLLVDANNRFAFRLFELLRKASPNSDIFFSPFSIESALMMTIEGARGETAIEMARALSFTPASRNHSPTLPLDLDKLRLEMKRYTSRLQPADKKSTDQDREKLEALRTELRKLNKNAHDQLRAGKFDLANQTNASARDMANQIHLLAKRVESVQFQIANSVWVDQSAPLRTEYLRLMQDSYGTGGSKPADFIGSPERERTRINEWVSQNTESKIQEMLAPGLIRSDTRMVLVNAIYFCGNWEKPFETTRTKQSPFFGSSAPKNVNLMIDPNFEAGRYAAFHSDFRAFQTPEFTLHDAPKEFGYPANGFQMVDLPYNGDEYQMTLLLPLEKDGYDSIANRLDFDRWQILDANMRRRTIDLQLPRFKMETSFDLKKAMQELGMQLAFSDHANFTRMSHALRLLISAIVHKAMVDVNEQGTEAAAATAVVMAPTGAAVISKKPFIPRVYADHPFLFMIRERSTGMIMFMGQYMNSNS